jgi:MFS family permease
MLSSSSFFRRHRLPGDRPFHLLLLALATSSCGDWLYNVALVAFVFERTHSGTWVALTSAARILPIVLLGPLGGVMADRHNRRTLMIASDLLRAGLMAALAAVAGAGLPVFLAPILAAAATAIASVQPPCVAASTARLVPEGELQHANALRSAVGQGAIVVGPALGAVVLLATSPGAAILLNGLTFIASATAILAIPSGLEFVAPEAATGPAASVLADIIAGARALRGAPAVVRLLCADVLCSAVYGMLTVTFVLLSRELGAGNSGYGLLLGAYGIGGLIGAIVTGRMTGPARWRPMLIAALVLIAAMLAILGTVPNLFEALAASLLVGGGMVVGEVLSETALPSMLDDDVLARAYGLAFPASLGGIVVGSLLAAPLVSLLGTAGTFTASGLTVLIACGLLTRRPLVAEAAPAVGYVVRDGDAVTR